MDNQISQNPAPTPSVNQASVNTPPSPLPVQNTIPPKKNNCLKVVGIVIAVVIVIFILLAWGGNRLEQKDLKTTNSNLSNTKEITNMNKTYKDFALSTDESSYKPENQDSKKGVELMISEKGDGFVKVNAASAQTTLKFPMGWHGYDTGQATIFLTPDEKTSLSLRFMDGGGLDFAGLKKQVSAEYQQYKGMGAEIENTDTADGNFLSKAVGVNQGEDKLFLVSVYTPDPRGTQYFYKMLLSGEAKDYDKYDGLIDLILKDREIIWAS